jgi:F-type H+-transporting ATPase subunit epsilon
MDKTFNLTILEPERIIYQGRALSLIAPCENGYLGVLADHAALAANVVDGKITVREEPAREPLVFHSEGKGFLEVLNNNVNLILNHTDAKDVG